MVTIVQQQAYESKRDTTLIHQRPGESLKRWKQWESKREMALDMRYLKMRWRWYYSLWELSWVNARKLLTYLLFIIFLIFLWREWLGCWNIQLINKLLYDYIKFWVWLFTVDEWTVNDNDSFCFYQTPFSAGKIGCWNRESKDLCFRQYLIKNLAYEHFNENWKQGIAPYFRTT